MWWEWSGLGVGRFSFTFKFVRDVRDGCEREGECEKDGISQGGWAWEERWNAEVLGSISWAPLTDRLFFEREREKRKRELLAMIIMEEADQAD